MKLITATVAVTLTIAFCFAAAFLTGRNVGRREPINSPMPLIPQMSAASVTKPTTSPIPSGPLVLSMPVSSGKMELTFASWKDYEVAKSKSGL